MKKKKMIIAALIVTALTLLVWAKGEKEGQLIEENQLPRQKTGEGTYEAELVLEIEGEAATEILISVPEQRLTTEEEELFLQEAVKEIEAGFAGKNTSLEAVSTKVEIFENYCEGMVQAGWEFSKPELVKADGSILQDKMEADREEVKANVYLTCEDSNLIYEFYFCIYRQEKSEKELIYEKLSKAISESGMREGVSTLRLPTEVDGHKLVWKNQKSNQPMQVFVIGMLVVMLLPLLDQEKEKEVQKIREE